jgi:hypothetical protein
MNNDSLPDDNDSTPKGRPDLRKQIERIKERNSESSKPISSPESPREMTDRAARNSFPEKDSTED